MTNPASNHPSDGALGRQDGQHKMNTSSLPNPLPETGGVVERRAGVIRDLNSYPGYTSSIRAAELWINEAANALASAQERERGLREALEPFANAYELFGSDCMTFGEYVAMRNSVDPQDFRKARSALSPNGADGA